MTETLWLAQNEDKASTIIAHMLCAQLKQYSLSHFFIYTLVMLEILTHIEKGRPRTIAAVEWPGKV